MNYSKAIIGGRLTRDPEVRYLPDGTAICKFSVAVNHRVKGQGGQWAKEVSYFDCTLFGKRGEAYAEHNHKGDTTLVEGELRIETWEDKKTSQKRSKVAIKCSDWQFVGGRREDQGSAYEDTTGGNYSAPQPAPTTGGGGEDMPF